MGKPHHSTKLYLLLSIVLAAMSIFLLAAFVFSYAYDTGNTASPDPGQIVEKAWQRARDMGSYSFITDIETTISPPGQQAPTRGARYERLYIEGQVDLPAQKLEMTLWEKGGQVLKTRQGIQIRVEGGQMYGRVGSGEWQEMQGSTDAFAPGQDPLAYLAGAREFILLGEESAQVPTPGGMTQLTYSRYGFTMDGPIFASYMRDQLEQRMAEAGQLPPGITLDVPEAFRGLTGQGELWIDEAGLPLRLVLDLNYPALYGELSQSHVKTDFSNFPDEAAAKLSGLRTIASWAQRSTGLPTTPQGWDNWWLKAGLLSGFLVMALFAVIRSRSRTLQATCAILIILSMILSPLWESRRAQAATQWLEAQRQQAQEQQKAAQIEQAQQADQASQEWDPLQNPLAQGSVPSSVDITAPDIQPNAPIQPILTVGGTQQAVGVTENSPDPNSDQDNDGLIYQEEMRLGTDPALMNSDLDGLGDGLEVGGFYYGNTRYYTNPLSSDTIGDGLVDTLECWINPPDSLPENKIGCNLDSDADGDLDIFERDNDNDGVPDAVDISPFSAITGYTDDNPFLLVINNLNPLPVLVDLQIRPTNPEHLVYTLSVLDWPTGDTQGQVQRVLNTTFATAVDNPMSPEEVEADPSAGFGDMRLIPMLEISVPYKEGHTRNLPVKPGFNGTLTATTPLEDWLDTDKLAKYGMAAHYLDEEGTLGIYLPLNLVADESGGSDVAFLAHFYYEPQANGDWGNAHQMRVVWWVEMLTDTCDSDAYNDLSQDVKDTIDFEAWCADPIHRIESVQIVHAYPEDWSLTGISVREDHGLKAAIAFEDADNDSDVNVDSSLTQLSKGLDSAFITARDEDNDGKRDITVNEIERRWNNQTNADNGIPNGDVRLWGIDKTALQVVKKTKEDLPHIDYQITLVMTTTQEILNSNFLPIAGCIKNCNTPRAVAPTLLYATEASARTANLDMGGTTMGVGVGGVLNVNMATDVIPINTTASFSWIPYRYGPDGWEVYPLDEYTDLYMSNMEVYFPANYPEQLSEEELAEMILLATCYYLGLTEGVSIIVQSDDDLTGGGNETLDDANIAIPSIIESIYRICDSINAAFGTKELFEWIAPQEIEMMVFNREGGDLWGDDDDFIENLPHRKGSFSERVIAGVKTGVCIAMAVTSAIFAVLAFTVDSPALPYIQAGLMLTGSAILLVLSLPKLFQSMGSGLFKSIGAELKGFSHSVGFKLAIIGAAFDVLAQVGLFIANVVVGDVDTSSIAFDAMLANLFAGIIVSVLLAVVYAIPIVGDVIYAIVSVLNWIFELVCAILGEDFEKSDAGSWVCGGITGILTRAMAWLIFSAKPIMDEKYEDGMQTAPPQISLERPDQGLQVDNALDYTIMMTETIRQTSLKQLDNWKQIEWFWQFNEKNLKKTTFDYSLTSAEEDLHDDLYLGKETEWVNIGTQDSVPYEQITREVVSEVKIPLSRAGINQSFATYFNQGYAIPVQECWGWPIPPVSGCGIKSEEDTGHAEIGQYFLFDVFPGSLDGFHALQAVSGGYRLSWGGSSLAFPILKDADADGLAAGSDPSDASWDADQDGLSDPFEQQIGTNPLVTDSDDDGLSDREELIYGADPNSKDGDHDGLNDAIEVNGWEFVYGWVDEHTPKVIWVTSDPLMYDTDFDGLSDHKEWLYGWNPLAKSEGKVLTFSSNLTEKDASGNYTPSDKIVKAGDQLRYEADVKNELDLRYMRGLLSADYPAGTLSGSVVPETFVLAPHEPATIQGDLGVQAGESGPVTLTQIAGAELFDAHAASNYAMLLLHLEEAADATVFLDEAGGVERHNAACDGSDCPVRQVPGILGKGVRFTDPVQFIYDPTVDISRGSIAVTMWISTTATGASPSDSGLYFLDGMGESVTLGILDGKPCAYAKTTPFTNWICGSTVINDGAWHHLAFNYDDTKSPQVMELYVDGVMVASQTATARYAFTYDAKGLVLGQGYLGDMDEVAIYDRALSAKDIYETANVEIFLQAHLDEPAGATEFAVNVPGDEGMCYPNSVCPAMGNKGMVRTAASFNGQQWINFGYDIEQPYNFTVSAWIKPQLSGDSTIDQHWQGVLGGQGLACAFYETDLHNCSFPSIEWKGDGACLRSEFGDVSASTNYKIDPVCGVAPADTWSQVTVTFRQASVSEPGYYNLYVNGVQEAEKILAPKSTLYQAWGGIVFYVGCSWSNTGNSPECPVDLSASTIPFHGSVDEVRIYKQGLTEEEVQDLYADDARPLYLHMDDAPGAYLVENANRQEPASCPSNLVGCPTSGVAGRMNQGSYFASAESDGLSTPASLDLSETTPGATLMAWVYPTIEGVDKQFVLGTDDGNPATHEWAIFQLGDSWAVDIGVGLWIPMLVDLNRWQQITAVFSPDSGRVKIYKNCDTTNSYSTSFFYPNHTNQITVACDSQKQYCFQGRLDEVQVHNRALTDGEIQAACTYVPQFSLHMDEAIGEYPFADDSQNGHDATCTGDACPVAGAAGQVGLAAEFDGLDDGINTTYVLSNQEGTIMAWAKPDSTSSLNQALIGSYGTDHFELYHKDGKWQLRMAPGAILAPASATVQPGQWQHLAVVVTKTGDIYHATLYLDGSPLPGGLDVTSYSLIEAGIGYNPNLNDRHFDGRIDEVAAYGRALSASEIKEIRDYQAGWVEELQPTDLTVDNLAPVAKLVVDSTIIANQPTQLLIETYDTTTAVTLAEWRVNGGAWVVAPPCQGADSGSAYCPVFTPGGAGTYLIEARATDRAGNISDITSASLYVDVQAPIATLDQEGKLVRILADASRSNTWTAALSGTISDGASGSGVVSLRVALLDALGVPVAGDSQAANVSGGTWSITYQLSEPLKTGPYTVQFEPEDRVGNHSLDRNHSISLDVTAPEPSLDGLPPGGVLAMWRFEESSGATRFADSSGMGNDAICGDLVCPISGAPGKYGEFGIELPGNASVMAIRELAVNETGFSLSAWFQTSHASPQTLFAAVDSSGVNVFTVKLDSSGKVKYTYSPPGGDNASITTKKTYNDLTWHHLSAQWHPGQIRLYLDGQLVRTVGSVEGVPPATVNVIVGIDHGTDPFVGFVDEVAIHGVWMTPAEVRSLAFTDPSKLHNQIPLQGTIDEIVSAPDAMLTLHLDEAGSPFKDSTAYDNNATCTSPACPTAESIDPYGPYGAGLHFDGVDDGLTIQSSSLNYLSNDLTVMAWIKPERLTGWQWVLSLSQCTGGGGLGFGLDRSGLLFVTYDTAASSSWQSVLVANQWQHIAAVLDVENNLTYYINGIALYTEPFVAAMANCLGDIQVGRTINTSGVAEDWFQGAIDEVQVFNRALTPEEILAQGHRYNAGIASLEVAYSPDLAGSTAYNSQILPGTEVYLPFDETADQTGNLTFVDISGSGNNGSCTQPNCPAAGIVGHTDSAVMFDGDDYVTVYPASAWTDYLTISTWIYPTGSDAYRGTFITRRGHWQISCLQDGTIRMSFRDTALGNVFVYPGYKAPLNQWTHLVVVYDAGIFRTYANGEQVGNNINTTGSIYNGGTLFIGAWPEFSEYFGGGLDDVMVITRALTPAEIEALYLGSEPVLHLPMDETWMVDGESLVDTSGWGQHGILYTGDAANVASPGQVGSGALHLDGVDDYVSLGDINEAEGFGDFTLSQWFYLDAFSPIGVGWAAPLGKGAWNGSDGWAVLVDNIDSSPDSHKINLYLNGTTVATIPAPSGGWQTGRWYHYVFTRSGSTIKGYLDGEDKVSSVSDIVPIANNAPLLLGKNQTGTYFWQGKLDDLQIFRRAISTDEVRALYNARWQAATLAMSGSTVMHSDWTTTLPDGLEGHYQLDLRGWDLFDNQQARRSTWDGMLDTKAPRLTLTYEGGPTTYTYHLSAEDWNLDKDSLQSPCPSSTELTYTYFNAPWYRALTGVTTPDSNRLYSLAGSCPLASDNPAQASLTACDLYGNCTVVQASAAAATALAEKKPPPETEGKVLILEPALGAILSNIQPVVLSGLAESDGYLKRLTISVDGKKVLNQKWDKHSIQTYNWSVAWSPAGAGTHLVEAELTNWSNDKFSHAITFILDTQPPSLSIATSVLSSTHVVNGQLPIYGNVTDANGIAGVEVRLLADGYGSDWTPAALDGTNWQALVFLGQGYQPDDQPLTIEARATDRAGWNRTVSRIISADLQPPAMVDLEITYSDGIITQPVTQTGTVISSPTPMMVLRWSASSDNSGISGYQAGWIVQDASGTTEILSDYGPTDELLADYQAGEAQRLTASVVSQDMYGNSSSQAFGPIYTDSPLTPDYIALEKEGETYRGWMDSGCSLLGVDRRANRRLGANASRDHDQALYTTWDQQALRLAWTGANWAGDGDLFVYLDTKPGGTLDAMNPYSTTATLHLPGTTPLGEVANPMYADEIVWVQDNQTAWLYRWNGSAWEAVEQLGKDQYQFTPGTDGGLTDLYLTFDLLEISDPENTPLKLVAMASEEGELQLWAVLPQSNPITSSYVTGLPRIEQAWVRFALNHPYRWEELRSGLCPNGSEAPVANQRHYTNDDLRWSVTVDPAGAAYRYLGDNLFGWWFELLGDKPAEFSSLLNGIASEHPSLHDGQEITYTMKYQNDGPEAAEDVVLQVRSRLALILPDGGSLEPDEHIFYQEIPVGDVAPGQAGVVTVRGKVDLAWAEDSYQECLVEHPEHPLACEFNKRWALLGIQVFDQAHTLDDGPREVMWVDHRVDFQPPIFVGINTTRFGLPAAINNSIGGYAYDESGVSMIRLEIMGPDGAVQQLECNDSTPMDGKWNCDLNLAAAQDGDVYQVRLQAVDGSGQVSDWGQWQSFAVDRTAPEVSVGNAPTYTLNSPPLNLSSLDLTGQVSDNYGVDSIEVCLDDLCNTASTSFDTQEWSYSDTPASPLTIGACGGGELVRTFTLTDDYTIGDVRLGFQAEIDNRSRLSVTLTSPMGTSWAGVGDDFDSSTNYPNLNAILSDRAKSGLQSLRTSQALTAGGFALEVRPLQPLAVFRNQLGGGTWSLSVCDTSGEGVPGLYHGAKLWVDPLNTAPLSANWQTSLKFEALDDVVKTIQVYGIDKAGNRTTTPQIMNFRVDNVAPVLMVTQVIPQVVMQPDLSPLMVLAGNFSDGGRVKYIHAFIRDPEGQGVSARPVVDDNSNWNLSIQPMIAGIYQVWVAAEDEAGNLTTAGPFTVEVGSIPVSAMDSSTSMLTITPTATVTPTVTLTPLPSLTDTPYPALTETPTPILTDTPTPTLTETPTPTSIWTATPTPMAGSP